MNNKTEKISQTEYKNAYAKSHYKQLKVQSTPDNINIISEYCKEMNISHSKYLTAAARYCIDNAIDIEELLSHLK